MGFSAVEWIDEVWKLMGGKKGGKDESAQGTCDNVAKIPDALKGAIGFIESKL